MEFASVVVMEIRMARTETGHTKGSRTAWPTVLYTPPPKGLKAAMVLKGSERSHMGL